MSDETKTEETKTSAETNAEATETPAAAKPKGKKTKDPLGLSSFFGVKAGMTRIFDSEGNHVPVTVVKLLPNAITEVKTQAKHGYTAYQVGYYEKRESLLNKPTTGKNRKAGLENNFTLFEEIRVGEARTEDVGRPLSLEGFEANTLIDVRGISKGKGFQGVIKRYGFAGGPAAHGSKFHRTTGSIGNRATPGKVWKNKKMPGHMGDKKVTVQNLKVVEVNADKGFMLIKGSVPGPKNGWLKIQKATKS